MYDRRLFELSIVSRFDLSVAALRRNVAKGLTE